MRIIFAIFAVIGCAHTAADTKNVLNDPSLNAIRQHCEEYQGVLLVKLERYFWGWDVDDVECYYGAMDVESVVKLKALRGTDENRSGHPPRP